MWISRKEYNFLKENAQKNIDAECEILRAKEIQSKAVARAMEEYSSVLKERDALRLRVLELERGQTVKIDPVDKMANKPCVSESDHEWEGCGISNVGSTYRCIKCGAHRIYPTSNSDSTTHNQW